MAKEPEVLDEEKGGLSPVLWSLLLVAMVLGHLAFAYLVTAKTILPKVMGATAAGEEGQEEGPGEEHAEEAEGGAAHEDPGAHEGPTRLYALDDITVNPASVDQIHYVSLALALEYPDDPEIEKEIEERVPLLRDRILTLLMQKDFALLMDHRYREELREELLVEMNKILAEAPLLRVYFTKYVFQ